MTLRPGAIAATALRPAPLELHVTRSDATAVLSLFVVLLIAIPAQWVVPGMGAAGRPAGLLGLGALVWLGVALLLPGVTVPGQGRPQPLRAALFALAASALVSYAMAFTRFVPGSEARGADRALLLVAAGVGVALLAAEGIDNRRRLDMLLQRFVWVIAVLAAVGLLQFATGWDLARLIRVPGLVENTEVEFVQLRSNFRRVAGTTLHPIEFGVLMASALPLALHLLLHDAPGRRRRWLLPLALIGMALPAAVSRTGILCGAVVVAVLLPTWPRSLRVTGLVIGAGATVALGAVVRGLIGTIRSLFTNLLQDDSTTGRTQDYAVVSRYVGERPLFGRGIGTFLPTEYTFLDNQYLLSLVETGAVGLVAIVGAFVVGASLARGARRRSADPSTRHLGQALAAAILAQMVSFATYDALSFPMATGALFLLLGCSGALWRLVAQEDTRPGDPVRGDRVQRTQAA